MLVEGPLNNLKESMIQFSKPKKLTNSINPVNKIFFNNAFVYFITVNFSSLKRDHSCDHTLTEFN